MSRNAFDCLHVYLQLFTRGINIDNVQNTEVNQISLYRITNYIP